MWLIETEQEAAAHQAATKAQSLGPPPGGARELLPCVTAPDLAGFDWPAARPAG
jgi:hypothetical protein